MRKMIKMRKLRKLTEDRIKDLKWIKKRQRLTSLKYHIQPATQLKMTNSLDRNMLHWECSRQIRHGLQYKRQVVAKRRKQAKDIRRSAKMEGKLSRKMYRRWIDSK